MQPCLSLAPKTRRQYEADFRKFQRWCAEQAGAGPGDLARRYADHMRHEGFVEATVKRHLAAIRRLSAVAAE